MRSPLFLLLLPSFFVFHGYVENFRYIRLLDCLPILGLYFLATLICFLIFRALLRENMKSALVSFYIMGFYLFFGAFHDFTRRHGIFLAHYSISLPLFLLIGVTFFLWLKKRSPPSRIGTFLNYLLVIYLVVDLVTLVSKYIARNDPAMFTSSQPQDTFRQCDSCATPDVYLLLFDEYTSSSTLRDTYHYDNSQFDSFLTKREFHILTNSRSNYFFTPFSMASIFNMSYLGNLKHPLALSSDDYIEALDPGRPAAVIRFLEGQGYDIINNSSFDLPGHPSSLDQPFIPVKTRLITNRTLFHYLVKDIGWWFVEHLTDAQALAESEAAMTNHVNSKAIERTLEESKLHPAKPRFIYMHVFMPHGPFLFDSQSHPKKMGAVVAKEHQLDLAGYLDYIPYTNARAEELITTIEKNTMGRAVIVFLSDHGYRYHPFIGHNDRVFFSNQNAIYYPDKDYRLLYDSMSTVNEFRVVFNKLFRQTLPLLRDSTILLRDGQ